MNGLDWLIVGILGLSALHAAAQGFVYELFSLVGTVCGYLLAAYEYRVVARYVAPYVKSELVANGTGFLLIFVGFMILAGVAARIARWAAVSVGLRWFDRMLGALFGLVRGGLAAVVLVMALAAFLPSARALTTSTLAPYFLVAGRGAAWAAPGELKQQFHKGLMELDRQRSKTGRARNESGSSMNDTHKTPRAA
jgi:membrane protein required for colicin V production